MKLDRIQIAHGSGGKITHALIKDMFFKYFDNKTLDKAEDSAVLNIDEGKIAFTTDSFVVKPVFFPGGDIGKLSICGTVNDLVVSGATPKYISLGFILEEGFLIKDLERIVISISEAACKADVRVVTGDTKVVEKGAADAVFINTSGVGLFDKNIELGVSKITPGDKIITSGTLGDHGVAVLSERKGLTFSTKVKSDCAPLNGMISRVLEKENIRFMRDPTRGGVATTLNEVAAASNLGILIEEDMLPVKEEVLGACELLGLDPLYIANEGKVLIITASDNADKVVDILKENEYGRDARVVGEVTSENLGKVCLKSKYGATRIIDMLTGEQLPRIC